MTREELERKPIGALRALAKAHGVRIRSTLEGKELVALLSEARGVASPAEAKTSLSPKMEAHRGEGEARGEKVVFAARAAEIPREYGSNAIVTLVRDPF